MTRPSGFVIVVWRTSLAIGAFVAMAAIVQAQSKPTPPPATGPDDAARPKVNPQAQALQEFQVRLDRYLELRSALAGKLKPLSSTPDAAELSARQEALAAAIRTARAKARRGDLIPAAAAQVIAQIVRADFKQRYPTGTTALFEEVPAKPGATLVNKTYPANAALATVPPLLLMNLPKLPDNLQYRFSGRDVVILDGDVQLVIDYIANVLPPHRG